MTDDTPINPPPSGTGRDPYSLLGAEIDGLRREIAELRTARTPILTMAQADLNNFDGRTTWGEALFKLVAVPRGYSQCYVMLFVSAGQTLAGASAGNVGVQPQVNGLRAGPDISNGVTGGGPVSVASVGAGLLQGLAPGSELRLGAACVNVGPVNAGSANAHLSAVLFFLR